MCHAPAIALAIAALLIGSATAHAQPDPAADVDAEPAANGAEAGQPDPPLTEEQQRELDLLIGVLDDSRLELGKRRDAAAALLGRGWPTAVAALADRLQNAESIELKRAIAAAVALRDDPPEVMVEPLIELVGATDALLRADVAAALGRYENSGVSEKLIALAGEEQADPPRRTGAIQALAEHRQAEVIEALIALIDEQQPDAIRGAAFTALARLTGIRDHGQRADAWRQWWKKHRNLPRDRWLARLVRSLSERNRRLTGERDQLTRRLAEAFAQTYRAMPEADRPGLLEKMLGDAVVEVRMQALDLIERKLLNAQAIAAPVRARLRGLMDDGSAKVRGKTIALLRDLDDEPAVDMAIKRVEGESDPVVQRAYLALLAHRPRVEALEPAMRMLDTASVQPQAAEVIAALAEGGLLDEKQQAAARQRALKELEAGEPAPSIVALLSRLATKADAERLEGLLDHEAKAVQLAAAEAFVSGRLDPMRLLDELGDAVLGGPAIEAAARHGQSVEVASRLLQHEPDAAEARQRWRTAILAVAGRLDGEALKRLDVAIGNAEGRRDLRLAALSHALALNAEAAPREVRAELLLRLAELRVAAGRVDEAGAVFDRLAQMELDADAADRLAMGRLKWLVAAGQYERLLTHAEGMLAEEGAATTAVGEQLLNAAAAAMGEQKTEQAAVLLGRVQQLDADGALAEAAKQRLADLRRKLAELQDTPPETDTPDAAG